ncbi:MAG: two-component sensor histidine kinase [Tyzzerella sp.]|nr:two-component sensor histidine kinase [Tyzzerella sp.]
MSLRSGEWVIILRDKMMKLKSLRFRIVVLLILVSSIPCFAIKETILQKYEDRAVAWRTAEIQNQCTILSNQLSAANYLKEPISEVINAELSQLSNVYDGRVMVIDEEYHIIKDTFGVEAGKTILSPDVIQCFSGTATSHYDGENRYIEITTPIMEREKEEARVKGVILVGISTDIIHDTLTELESKANLLFLMAMLVVIVAGSFLAYVMVKPFGEISQVIEDITEGYDNDNLHVDTYTETMQISEAFNKMRSRMKVLDDSRQEFVSNVSHELKTPLTSMKVLADSLLAQEDVPVELYKEFMGDITEEIERENKIINDLLSLVKMDKTAADLNVKSENINELVERILKRLRPIAALRNIELVFESFRPVTAEVDEVKLSLAISNLVENAIKYNKENGWVQVSLNADHKYFYVKVADSGMGIPQESLDHIFERFYRVDKSHSKEISGTGLGLAIARNAIITHRGAIKVHSEEGEGTTFTVRVPLNYIV